MDGVEGRDRPGDNEYGEYEVDAASTIRLPSREAFAMESGDANAENTLTDGLACGCVEVESVEPERETKWNRPDNGERVRQ